MFKGNGWMIAAGVAAYLLYRTQVMATSAAQVNYNIQKVDYNKKNSNALRTQLDTTLRIYNPTVNTLGFTSFSGAVKMNGVQVASVNYNPGTFLPLPPGATDIVFPVWISHLSSVMSTIELIEKWSTGRLADLKVEFNGILQVGPFQVPVSQTVSMDKVINGIGNIPLSGAALHPLFLYL